LGWVEDVNEHILQASSQMLALLVPLINSIVHTTPRLRSKPTGIVSDIYLFSGRSSTSWNRSLSSSDRPIFSLFLREHPNYG